MRQYNSLYIVLSNFRLINRDGNELSQDELRKLWEFYNLMTGSPYARFIFRGESDRNLMAQFNTDTQTPEILSECLFMTGEKGRLCWADNDGMNPDDVGTENFLTICRALARYIDEGLKSGGNRAKRIKTFCEKEEEFCKGLKDEATLACVYERLNPEDKKKVNLYYLAIAHTVNDKEYKDTSVYISTTTNDGVADRFAHDACIYYVNPAIYDAIDKMHELRTFREMSAYKRRLQQHGLEINQENFEEFCQRTNFKKYFTFDGDNYAIHGV